MVVSGLAEQTEAPAQFRADPIVIERCGGDDLAAIFLLAPNYVNQGHKRPESPC